MAAKQKSPPAREHRASRFARSPAPQPGSGEAEYTIDELAREGDSTVRNVRAYQDRGLLPPPQRRGRTGWYSHDHLARLRLIGTLLARGYTLGNIGELIEALERGNDLHDIIGLERAITSPWSAEQPRHFSLAELLKMFGVVFNPRTLAKVIELGLLEPDGLRYRAPSPKMLIAGAELAKAGMPLDDLLKVIEGLRANVQRVADQMVQLIAHLLDHYGEGQLPPREDVPRLADTIWRLRPLAMMAVESEVSRALEMAANKFLGERVAQILEQMQH
ncbi:MAG: MerR family transcriptional regulator [Panacagrimonas sp.]